MDGIKSVDFGVRRLEFNLSSGGRDSRKPHTVLVFPNSSHAKDDLVDH